ncbi:thiamine pyrophosphokinase [Helicocarpus griseus UAMH5409]|uniref:Thiamine pyrophosphokinase n=1 Tax=Helicocarpus griseus UAMH5409 TaxID=1447875 RepID=A0A2B7WFU7_9EURO|nr:thiamine pyrophosphokinase [Helicocarpus griseus UAMH5409]
MDWYPAQFFDTASPPSTPFAILVLNQPINQNAYNVLKKRACFTICADGGANRFYSLMHAQGKESIELPNAILGDLDSISPQVRKHYEDLRVPVLYDPDQETTDFTKCLHYLHSHAPEIISSSSDPASNTSSPQTQQQQQLNILILGGLGGRVDQAVSQIHHLYMPFPSPTSPSQPSPPPPFLYLISEESMTFILHQGLNRIHTPGGSSLANPPTTQPQQPLSENIGILPVAGPATITTHGLEWDVAEWKTEFGGRLSTSNHIRAEVVEVWADGRVLVTLELGAGLKWR